MVNLRIALVFITLLLVIFLAVPGSGSSQQQTKAMLVNVIDGDTIIVKQGSVKSHVRLIGIDCPEARVNDKAIRDAQREHKPVDQIIKMGKIARERLASLVEPGDQLTLVFDAARQDRFQRLLAYVYLDDGTFLNEYLIKNGLAYPMSIPPNVKFANQFRKLFNIARQNRYGLWNHD